MSKKVRLWCGRHRVRLTELATVRTCTVPVFFILVFTSLVNRTILGLVGSGGMPFLRHGALGFVGVEHRRVA